MEFRAPLKRLVSVLAGVAGLTVFAQGAPTVTEPVLKEGSVVELADPVVELPAFLVEEKAELPPREAWRYGTIPGFEILSNASDKVTQEQVHALQTAVQVGELFWPINLTTNRRTTVILCKDAKACEDFGFIEYIRKTMHHTWISHDRVADWEQQFIICDASRSHGRQRSMAVTYYYRCNQIEPRPPDWMATFGTNLISTGVKVDNEEVRLGSMGDSFREISLAERPFTRLSETFDMTPAVLERAVIVTEGYWRPGQPLPPKNRDQGSSGMFIFGQWMAFTQLCLLEKPQQYEASLVRFINRARLEPVTEKLFEDCFGKSLLELEKETTDYQERVRFMTRAPVKIIKGTLKYASFELRDATDAEVGRIKGEALALLENPKIAPRAMLRAPYVRGERDPQLLAAIGLHERELGNAAEARRFLEVAVREKVDRPRAYLELARMHYDEKLRTLLASGGTLNAEQIRPAMELLERARNLPAQIPEVYDLIAEIAAHSEISAARSCLVVIDEGLRLFPYHAELVCQAAAAFAHTGHSKEAAKLVEYGLVRFRYYEPGYRERLERLEATLHRVERGPTKRDPESVLSPVTSVNSQ